MCETCELAGLRHLCEECGGFDWVDDVYLKPEILSQRLCVACRGLWAARGYQRL